MSPKNPTKRLIQAQASIATMKSRGYVRIPSRRWTRCFKKAGVPVVHGPVSSTRTGNWAPRQFVTALTMNRLNPRFRKLPFHLQVEAVVWWLTRGNNPQPSQAP